MLNKKRVIPFMLLLGCFVVILVVFYGMSSFGWFQSILHLNTPSEQIYSIKQGYNNDISTELNIGGPITLSEGGYIEKAIIPGETIYYSFVSKIKVSEYDEIGIRDLVVSVNATAKALDSHTENSGNYQSFLSNCMIEENTCILSFLKETSMGVSDTAKTYSAVSYKIVDGETKICAEEEDGSFRSFTSTSEKAFESTGVDTLLSNGNFSAQIVVHLPDVDEYEISESDEDGETIEYIDFVIYIPIIYVDTNEIQNVEMDCTIEITGCTILPLISEETEE